MKVLVQIENISDPVTSGFSPQVEAHAEIPIKESDLALPL